MNDRARSESWEQIPLILLSGMGADERIFEPQIEKFPRLIVPKWIDPLPNESIPSYARRFAERIDPKRPCFIGGASFGGFVAVEMARHLDAKACFLIGSVKSADDLPLRVRILRPAAAATATIPVGWFCRISGISAVALGDWSSPATKEFLKQVSQADADFLRWATRAVLTWRVSAPPTNIPICHIHGDRDLVLPIGQAKPDRVVAGAGHVLSLSHPRQVNAYLEECMRRYGV